MPNPSLTTKQASTFTLTEAVKDLFRAVYQDQKKEAQEDESINKIAVNDIISKMSFFYEKIRNAVDYQEEHLLRKNAIERILKRIMTSNAKSEEMAKTLLIELIRAGYLPNNEVPETKINELAVIIENFIKLRQLINGTSKKEKGEHDELRRWIINLAATNIEENLGNQKINIAVGKHMYEVIAGNIIDDKTDADYTRDKKIQTYLAIYSKLFKYDDAMLEFLLFRYFNPKWNNATDEELASIAQHYHELQKVSEQQLNHPFKKQLQRVANRYTIYFSILIDAIAENPEGTYDKLKNRPDQFKKLVDKICDRRYKESSGKLRRGAIRSIIYIFLTKTILVFILEVPAIMLLGEELVYYSLAINVLFPPTLLALIVIMTALPGNDNTHEIQKGISEIVFIEKKEAHPVQLHYPMNRSSATSIVFRFLYLITFLFSFGAVIWFLIEIHFNIVSILIFLFFLSMISFFGIRLSRFAKAYSVIDTRENAISFFANFFYVPIVGAGKWLSETFSQLNVFIIVLDFIIESPFKIFIEMFEQWTAYVKERKENVVD